MEDMNNYTPTELTKRGLDLMRELDVIAIEENLSPLAVKAIQAEIDRGMDEQQLCNLLAFMVGSSDAPSRTAKRIFEMLLH